MFDVFSTVSGFLKLLGMKNYFLFLYIIEIKKLCD